MATQVPLRRIFPQSAEHLAPPPESWDFTFDPSTSVGIEALYALIVRLQNRCESGGLPALVDTARSLRTDLLNLEGQAGGPLADEDVHALMLATTLGPAATAVVSGQLNVAYDWLLWSLTTTWDRAGEHMMHFYWLRSACQSQVEHAAAEIVSPWLDTLFMYDRQFAGLPSMTNALAPQAVELAKSEIKLGWFGLAGTLLGWAGSHPTPPHVAKNLQFIASSLADLADNTEVPAPTRMAALRPLALCSGEVTGQDRIMRSQQLLDEFGDHLNSTDKLGLLATVYASRPDDLAEDIGALTDLALDHHAQFAGADSAAATAWARGSKHSLINVPIHTLLLGGHVDAAVRLLRAWRGLADDAPRPRPLVGVLAGSHGVGWVAEGSPLIEPESGPSLVDYQTVSNAFLSTTVTVNSSPDMPIDLPEREPGRPNERFAKQYIETLEPFLDLEGSERAHAAAEVPPSSLLVIPSFQAPIQVMMLRNQGWTLPLTTTLKAPAPDRKVRRALLYLGGSLFTPAEEEILEDVLGGADIATTVRHDPDLSRDQFVEDYDTGEYDLVWVGTHGVFDGLQPEDAYLHLSETERVALADLRPPMSNQRRLLVLNSCDGAVTAQTGGVGEIGLAAFAADPAQAVISHLWPIESPTTALMFAGVLARALVTAPSFFKAYQSAAGLLMGDLSKLRENVAEYSTRLANLIDDKPESFERFTGWASSAFLE